MEKLATSTEDAIKAGKLVSTDPMDNEYAHFKLRMFVHILIVISVCLLHTFYSFGACGKLRMPSSVPSPAFCVRVVRFVSCVTRRTCEVVCPGGPRAWFLLVAGFISVCSTSITVL